MMPQTDFNLPRPSYSFCTDFKFSPDDAGPRFDNTSFWVYIVCTYSVVVGVDVHVVLPRTSINIWFVSPQVAFRFAVQGMFVEIRRLSLFVPPQVYEVLTVS